MIQWNSEARQRRIEFGANQDGTGIRIARHETQGNNTDATTIIVRCYEGRPARLAELQEVRSNDEVVREIRELLEKMSMGQTFNWTIVRSFRKCRHDRSPGCWPAARDPVGRRSPPRETSGASLATGDRVRLRPCLRTGSRRLELARRRSAFSEVSGDRSQGGMIVSGRSQFQGSLCRCVFQVSTRRAYPFERSRVERPTSSAIAEKSAAHD